MFHEFGDAFSTDGSVYRVYRVCRCCGLVEVNDGDNGGWSPWDDTGPTLEACWQARANNMLNQMMLQFKVQAEARNLMQREASQIMPAIIDASGLKH